LAALASAQVPGLTIGGLHGPFPAKAGAARITLADADGVWLTIDEARLALDYSALLRGVFRIEAVEAARVEISRPPLSSAAATPPDPRPPSQGCSAAVARPAGGDRARSAGHRQAGDRRAGSSARLRPSPFRPTRISATGRCVRP
jgi:hypothetical protein